MFFVSTAGEGFAKGGEIRILDNMRADDGISGVLFLFICLFWTKTDLASRVGECRKRRL